MTEGQAFSEEKSVTSGARQAAAPPGPRDAHLRRADARGWWGRRGGRARTALDRGSGSRPIRC